MKDDAVPKYLLEPETDRHLHGRVWLKPGKMDRYVIEAEPNVLQFAKRVFPGCRGRVNEGQVMFPATRRSVGDLNWLMLRYPLSV